MRSTGRATGPRIRRRILLRQRDGELVRRSRPLVAARLGQRPRGRQEREKVAESAGAVDRLRVARVEPELKAVGLAGLVGDFGHRHFLAGHRDAKTEPVFVPARLALWRRGPPRPRLQVRQGRYTVQVEKNAAFPRPPVDVRHGDRIAEEKSVGDDRHPNESRTVLKRFGMPAACGVGSDTERHRSCSAARVGRLFF